MGAADEQEALHERLSWALDHLGQPRDCQEAAGLLADLALEPSMVPRVAPALGPLLLDPDPSLRAAACAGLARCKRPEDLLALLGPMAQDPDVHVRREVVRSLAMTERAEVEPHLRRFLGDADAQVRFEAAVGLASLQSDAGVEVLAEATRDRMRRFGALGALARLGHPSGAALAVETLGRVWATEFDRTQAAGLLARLGDPRGAERLLKRVARRGADDRGLAMELCGEHRILEAEVHLRKVASDPGDPFQGTAARSLGLLGVTGSRELLLALAGDEAAPVEVRCDAMEGLMFLKTEQTRSDLEAMALCARPLELREAARDALSWLDEHVGSASPSRAGGSR